MKEKNAYLTCAQPEHQIHRLGKSPKQIEGRGAILEQTEQIEGRGGKQIEMERLRERERERARTSFCQRRNRKERRIEGSGDGGGVREGGRIRRGDERTRRTAYARERDGGSVSRR
jgi:hypothetical protein